MAYGLVCVLMQNKTTAKVPLMSRRLIENMYTSKAAALGGLYVMEGSILGGAIIYRHLLSCLGETIKNKASYFTSYGAQTGSKWKAFLGMLCAEAEASGEQEVIIKSAIKTFVLLNKWMSSECCEYGNNVHKME